MVIFFGTLKFKSQIWHTLGPKSLEYCLITLECFLEISYQSLQLDLIWLLKLSFKRLRVDLEVWLLTFHMVIVQITNLYFGNANSTCCSTLWDISNDLKKSLSFVLTPCFDPLFIFFVARKLSIFFHLMKDILLPILAIDHAPKLR
jgi:hypothetical protein